MSPRPVSAATGVHAALASPIRRRLMDLLREDQGPRDAHDLGEEVGLHPSTVRFHLETLRQAGLVTRQPSPTPGLGRPRTAYAATARADEHSGYADLARLLAANLAETPQDRATRAEAIGGQWADQLVPVTAGPGAGLDETATRVTGLFDDLGFEPELRADGPRRTIALHACPFRGVAREHPEVVCALHLGLLRGSLERLGASVTSRLVPFVEPRLCMVEVTPSMLAASA